MELGKSLRQDDALCIKNAELCLRMGEPEKAVRVLQSVNPRAWRHPWIESVLWRAATALEVPSSSVTLPDTKNLVESR